MNTSFKKIAGLTTSALLLTGGLFSLNTTAASAAVAPILANFETDDTSGYALGVVDTIDFGGTVSSVANDFPGGGVEGSVSSAKIVNGAACYSGVTFLDTAEQLTSVDNKVVTMNVYAPTAGVIMKFKLETAVSGGSVETDVVTTKSGWQRMTFDLTAGYNDSAVYHRAIIFPNFTCVSGTHDEGAVYYIDDVAFNGATTAALPVVAEPVSVNFESGDTSGYALGVVDTIDFGGNVSSVDSAAPAWGSPGSTAAAKIVLGGECYAGTTFLDTAAQLTSKINKVVTMNLYAPAAGQSIKFKLETAANGSAVETDVVTTKAGWQRMTFDLTSGYDESVVYHRAIIFTDFTCGGSETHDTGAVYYFDDVSFNGAATPTIALEPVFTPTLVNFEPSDVSGYYTGTDDFGGEVTSVVSDAPANGSLGSTRAMKLVTGSDCYSGASFLVGTNGLKLTTSANKVVTMNLYAPAAGQNIKFKLEGDGGAVVEADVLTTKVGWQKLTFDLTNGYDDAYYTKAVVFPDFTCVSGDHDTGSIYYMDDVAFNGATTAALDTPVVVPPVVKSVTLAATSTVKGKVYVTVKNAKGKSIKVVVAGGSTVKKTANSDNYVIKITTKKGSHKVTVTVGAKKLVKTLKVK